MPDFPIYNKCNNKCVMCTNPDNYGQASALFEPGFLLNRLKRFHRGEKEFLNNYRDSFALTGGEPTLSPDLFLLLEQINRYFPKARTVVLTNGRRFCYEDYAGRVLEAQANLDLVVALHAHTARLHDSITRSPGSFRQTIKGITNIIRIKKPGQAIEIRVVIHKMNYKYLKNISKFILARFPQIERIVYIFFELEGMALKNIRRLALTYTDVRPYIDDIQGLARRFRQARFYHFPLCVFPGGLASMNWRTLPSYEVSFPKTCVGCSMRRHCLGIPRDYLKYYGMKEFRALK